MTKINAILTKPLDGQPEGTEREFDKVDFDRLKELGAVRKAPEEKAAPSHENKMAPPVANKSATDPLDHDGDGRKGGAKKPQ